MTLGHVGRHLELTTDVFAAKGAYQEVTCKSKFLIHTLVKEINTNMIILNRNLGSVGVSLVRIWIRRSIPLTNGSGSKSCYFFVSDLQYAFKNYFLLNFCLFFLKLHVHHFSKIKVIKKSQNGRNEDFSYYFCLMIEGSGAGSVPRTKNMWILRIREGSRFGSPTRNLGYLFPRESMHG
jgi:hypothetical protein